MFGRTRRKEAERFTRSVVTMRTEARSLEALLEVLSQRIHDSRAELTMMSQHLMNLGDEATGKLGGITREFDASSERSNVHGEALDRAAESARNKCRAAHDLPKAEQTAPSRRGAAEIIGSESADQGGRFRRAGERSAEQTRAADELVAQAADRLAARLAEIDSASNVGSRLASTEAQGAFTGRSTSF